MASLRALVQLYPAPNAAGWNITLHYAVTETAGQTSVETLKMIDPQTVRREFIRNGVTSVNIQNAGVGSLTNGQDQASIPAWSVLAAKLVEFPLPMIAQRLLDTTFSVEAVLPDSSAPQLTHIRVYKTLGSDGKALSPALAPLYETHLYIDQKTGLLAKQRYRIFSPSSITNSGWLEVSYDDYRPVEQMMIPFHVVKRIGSHVVSDATLDNVNLHASNAPADF